MNKERAIKQLREAEETARRSEQLRHDSAKERREAVQAALDAGLSLREVGAAIGKDRSRVWQIANGSSKGNG